MDVSHVKSISVCVQSIYQFFCDYGYIEFKFVELDCETETLVFVNAVPLQDELQIELTCHLERLKGFGYAIHPEPYTYNVARFHRIDAINEIGVYRGCEYVVVYSDRRYG